MTGILVCGGRDFIHSVALTHMLDMYHTHYDIPELIHGGARGADSMAGRWAKERDIPVKVFPTQWDKYGKSAGYAMYQQMRVEGRPSEVIAFSGGRGTKMMTKLALDHGYRVWIVKIDPDHNALFSARRYSHNSYFPERGVRMYNTTRGGASYNDG